MQMVALQELPDMSNGSQNNKQHLFQCLQVNILKESNVIPNNSYHFCIMGRDHGSGKPRSWSKNQLLLEEGALILSSPELKAQGELIGWDSSRRPYVRPCVRLSVGPHFQTWQISLRPAAQW